MAERKVRYADTRPYVTPDSLDELSGPTTGVIELPIGLDWSERRDHLAGKLASGLLTHFIARGWLRRIGAERALELTPPGQQALAPLLATG